MATGLTVTAEAGAKTPAGPAAPVAPPASAGAQPPSPPRSLAAGTKIKHYELIRELGAGGMGQVYLARDLKLGRLVALKLLRRPDERSAERLLAEARATARCQHENIVVIHDVDEVEGDPYLVLEYVEGETLRAWLDRQARAPRGAGRAGAAPGSALELMVPVVRALVCAHEQGIVHRDLKPENVLLSDAGRVKVVDFGIATCGGRDAGPAPAGGPGRPAGTYLYMAPEQWLGEEPDHRVDLWAVGVMLYELCAGEHPLARATPAGEAPSLGAWAALVRDPDRPLPSLLEARPEAGALAGVVDRCLAKRKEARFASARELLAALEALSADRRERLGDEAQGPFRGLAAFQEADAGRFFGREPDVAAVARALRPHPLMAVAGPSGAGKSSFVRAGVVPALKRSGERWEAFVLRPGRAPLSALAELLIEAREPGEAPEAGGAAALADELRLQPGLFGARLRERCRRREGRALVFADQFEELYALGADPAARAAFVACLLGAADDASSPLRVIVALRSDFLDRVLDDPGLAVEVARGLWALGPVGREGLRRALVRPVEALGHRFESPGLVERALDALEGARSPLPLLQFAAARLWDERDRARRLLTEASYERVGGVEGALAAHADAVFDALSPRERRLARDALVRLVTPERTRASASVGELRDLVREGDGRGGALEQVVRRLADARLVAIEAGEGDGAGATVELMHESLIERWPRLRRWLDERARDAQFLARLRDAARQWEAGGRAPGLLWREGAALEARAWLERHRAAPRRERAAIGAREERFLRAVVDLGDRAQRLRRRATAALVAALGLVAAVVSYLAVTARREAQRARAEALRTRNATRLAVAREKQADPTTALALVRELEPPDRPEGWATVAEQALRLGIARAAFAHPDVVYTAAFSPDGRRLVTASNDKTVRVFRADGAAAEPLVSFAHPDYAAAAAFSPDGRRIATASADKAVRIWPADGAGEPVVLRGHDGAVFSVAWSPDGARLATGSVDNTVRVWPADGAGEPVVLRGHDGDIQAVAFSPDGRHLASASEDMTARVWDADGVAEPAVLRGHEGLVYQATFSPDGRRVVTASSDRTARVWAWAGGDPAEPVVLRGHGGTVYSAEFSPDGRRVATASADRTARVFRADGSGEALILRGHENEVLSITFSPDGGRLATASYDGTARVWDAAPGRGALALYGHRLAVHSAAFSPDGRRVVTASSDRTARVWAADGSGEPVVLRGPEAPFNAAAFSPDGRRVVTATDDRVARVWAADDGRELAVLRGHGDRVLAAAFSPDGRRVVTASADRTARVWAADGAGEPAVLRDHDDAVNAAEFSPDGRLIVTASDDKTARVWSADDGRELVVLRGHGDRVLAAAFSPDGRRVVTASADRTARVWAADGAGEPAVLRGHHHWVSDAAFSPDGATVGTSSLDGTIRLWAGAGAPRELRHEGAIYSLAFSPDGGRLVIGTDDATVWVWSDLEPLLGPDDPRLWAATTYCLPAERRLTLLREPEAQARESEYACRRRVAEARAGGAR
ncbi:MAG TPA: protein kinase [Polyangiaceae bacterium]|nr:protein kinase [Polyangiaceae bacterium]